MDILFELSDLLFNACFENRDDPERRKLISLEGKLLDKIVAQTGEELVVKLLDAQEERVRYDCFSCFLYGLRLGVELLRLQGG